MQHEAVARWHERPHQDAGLPRMSHEQPQGTQAEAGPSTPPRSARAAQPAADNGQGEYFDLEELLGPRVVHLRPPRAQQHADDPAAAPQSQAEGRGASLAGRALPSAKGKEKATGEVPAERKEGARSSELDDPDFEQMLESLIRKRRWLLQSAERASQLRRARIHLRGNSDESQKARAIAAARAVGLDIEAQRAQPMQRRQQQQPAVAPQPAPAQAAQAAPAAQPASQPAAAQAASQPAAAQAPAQAAQPVAQAAQPQGQGAQPPTVPALEVPMESAAPMTSQLATILATSSVAPSSTAAAAASTTLALTSTTLAATTSAPAPAPPSSNGGTGHNVGFILLVSVGSAIVAATLIGGLAWMFRLTSSKSRVNKRKRLERGNWSPGAGSSVFSLREAEKALLAGSTIDSPMPALTSSRPPHLRDAAPVTQLQPIPAATGRGWTLFDNPMPRRVPSLGRSPHDAHLDLGLAPDDVDSSWRAAAAAAAMPAEERERDVTRDMVGVWPPATRRPSVIERLLHKRSWSEGLPLQHAPSAQSSVYTAMRRRSAIPLGQPSSSLPWSMGGPQRSSDAITFTDPFASRQPSSIGSAPARQKSTGVLSSLSQTILRAISRASSAPSQEQQPSASSIVPPSELLLTSRRDSQIPAARRLTKKDPRFRCDDSTTEGTDSLRSSPRSLAQPLPPLHARVSPALETFTPGLAGIGAAFRDAHANLDVHVVRVPEPALLPGTQLSSLSQLQRQQELLSTVGAAQQDDPDGPAGGILAASIAQWQARSQDARAASPVSSSAGSSSFESSGSSLLGSRRAKHRRAALVAATRGMTTAPDSPATSVSEGSSVSVRAAKRAAALSLQQRSPSQEGSPIRFDVDAFWAAEKRAAATALAATRDRQRTKQGIPTRASLDERLAGVAKRTRTTAAQPDLTALSRDIDAMLGKTKRAPTRAGASEVSISSASDISHRRWPAAPGQQPQPQQQRKRSSARTASAKLARRLLACEESDASSAQLAYLC